VETVVGIFLGIAMTIMFFAANLEVQSVIAKIQSQSATIGDTDRLRLLRKRLYWAGGITIIYGALFLATAATILIKSQLLVSAGFWIPGGIGLIFFAVGLFVQATKLSLTNIEALAGKLHAWYIAFMWIGGIMMLLGIAWTVLHVLTIL